MSVVAEKTRYEPEDLLTMPDGDRFELVDGELVERPMSLWSSYVGRRIASRLHAFVEARQLGWVLGEGTTFQCFPHDPKLVRKADVSFIRLSRLSVAEARLEGHVRIAPDLVVEVISPNDHAYDVDAKLEEYLAAGVRLVWIVNPEANTVRIHRGNGTVSLLRAGDTLDGEDVVPGFSCPVNDLFQPAAGATQT